MHTKNSLNKLFVMGQVREFSDPFEFPLFTKLF